MSNINYVEVPHKYQAVYYNKIDYEYWSNINKRYLLRIYDHLRNVMGYSNKPKWSQVVYEMLGHTHPGYYSSVYKALKEIGVIKYNRTTREMETGPNWERFYGSEDWSWFYMDTNSGMKSYVKYPKKIQK